MQLRNTASLNEYKRMTNQELRDSFVINDVFKEGEISLTYTDIDRAIVGGVIPTSDEIVLPTHKELAAEYFCERREVGVINIGNSGSVVVDGERYGMNNRDSLYIARGSKEVAFKSDSASEPAKFYLVSYPAHRSLTTTHVTKDKANRVALGAHEDSNTRVIYQSICPAVVETCQIVMGITELEPGNVWNTKPPHTHKRRTEVYMYFDMKKDERVFHFMGEPSELRSLALNEGDAIVSPSWSIHSGAGTSSYTFIWSMGGENQDFDDMDHLNLKDLG